MTYNISPKNIGEHFEKYGDFTFHKRDYAGWIYLVECLGIYKIGQAACVEKRIKQMESGNPFPINLIHTMNSYYFRDIEKVLLEKLVSYRIRNEWFKLPMFVVYQLCQIKDHIHPAQIAELRFDNEYKQNYDPRIRLKY